MNTKLKQTGWALARGATLTAEWIGDRIEDAAMWLVNLFRDLPRRLSRLLLTAWQGLWGMVSLAPSGVRVLTKEGWRPFGGWLRARALAGLARAGILLMQTVDLLGLGELFSLVWRAVTRSTPLTGYEIMILSNVLGPTALRYRDVRVAEGGLLHLVFRLNGGRAFTTFHTVNFPVGGKNSRANLDILVHELVHVYQHERVGGVYLGQCVHAQATKGYRYGGPLGLKRAKTRGIRYRDFNREQQAQIVQDYHMRLRNGLDTSAYLPYIEEMRAGKL